MGIRAKYGFKGDEKVDFGGIMSDATSSKASEDGVTGNMKMSKMDLIRLEKMRREAKGLKINEGNAERTCARVMELINQFPGAKAKIEELTYVEEGKFMLKLEGEEEGREVLIKKKGVLDITAGIMKEVM